MKLLDNYEDIALITSTRADFKTPRFGRSLHWTKILFLEIPILSGFRGIKFSFVLSLTELSELPP